MTEVRLRPLAEADLVERSAYYRSVADDSIARRFFETAIESLRAIEKMPGAGSPRISELCGIPGLRSRRLAGFPCGWFYFERSDHADVVRLLAYSQDLATILGDLDQA